MPRLQRDTYHAMHAACLSFSWAGLQADEWHACGLLHACCTSVCNPAQLSKGHTPPPRSRALGGSYADRAARARTWGGRCSAPEARLIAKKRQKSVRALALGNRRLMLSLNAKLKACVGKYLRACERRRALRLPVHSLLAEDRGTSTGNSASKTCLCDRGHGPGQAGLQDMHQGVRAKVEGKRYNVLRRPDAGHVQAVRSAWHARAGRASAQSRFCRARGARLRTSARLPRQEVTPREQGRVCEGR